MIVAFKASLDLQSTIIYYTKQSQLLNTPIPFVLRCKKSYKDKIQPVLQRFKLRSCNLSTVEQTDLLSLCILVDKIIQHRGSNHIYR